MTFSILALDRASGAIGCAAATGNLAVGGWVLRASAHAGAAATQGYSVSSLWGDDALTLMADGNSAIETVAKLTDADTGRDFRQLAVLDRQGGTAAWTGSKNQDVKGEISGDGYIVTGNWLSHGSVLTEMAGAYERGDNEEPDFGQRLLNSLQAAMNAGSDSRGTLSAAIRIVHCNRPPLDLRVDFDPEPLERLRTLYRMATTEPYTRWIADVPTLEDPYRC